MAPPAIRKLVLLTLLGFTGFAATLASLPWWTVRNGVPQSAAGLVTTVMLGVTLLAQFLVPTAERRLGTGRRHVPRLRRERQAHRERGSREQRAEEHRGTAAECCHAGPEAIFDYYRGSGPARFWLSRMPAV